MFHGKVTSDSTPTAADWVGINGLECMGCDLFDSKEKRFR